MRRTVRYRPPGCTDPQRQRSTHRRTPPVACAVHGHAAYLDAVHERVVVFDGAFGTFVQGLDLGRRRLRRRRRSRAATRCSCLTRPDVIAGMHEAFFDVGVDAVETASFGSFSHRAHRVRHRRQGPRAQRGRGPHRPRGRRRLRRRRPRPLRRRLDRARAPSCRASATSRFAELRDAYEEQAARPARGRRRPVPHRDRAWTCCRPRRR